MRWMWLENATSSWLDSLLQILKIFHPSIIYLSNASIHIKRTNQRKTYDISLDAKAHVGLLDRLSTWPIKIILLYSFRDIMTYWSKISNFYTSSVFNSAETSRNFALIYTRITGIPGVQKCLQYIKPFPFNILVWRTDFQTSGFVFGTHCSKDAPCINVLWSARQKRSEV